MISFLSLHGIFAGISSFRDRELGCKMTYVTPTAKAIAGETRSKEKLGTVSGFSLFGKDGKSPCSIPRIGFHWISLPMVRNASH